MSYTDAEIQRVVRSYLEAALWTATDEDGEPLDRTYDLDNLSSEAESQAQDECDDFLGLLDREGIDYSAIVPEQFGHDFSLTRNHHGAGFWDRGLGELGDVLTKWAQTMGGADLYVADDGRLYFGG